jgi:O-antigen ligase
MKLWLNRRSEVKGIFVLFIFALGAAAFAAGGLGLAPFGALGGVGALLFGLLDRLAEPKRPIRWPGPTAWAGVALLAWAALSLLWSEYDRPSYLMRTASGAPVYIAFFLLCLTLDDPGRRIARAGVVLAVAGGAAFFAFELATQGAITGGFRAEGHTQEQIWRNLGHGLSGWVVVLPAALLVLPRSDSGAMVFAGVLVSIGAACALGFGLSSNLAGLIAAAGFGAAAWIRPRAGLKALGAATAAAILLAPAFGVIARAVPAAWREAMPDSWALRIEAWSYASKRIFERPIEGWGFDASRAMTETIPFNGEDVQVLPLHPHNAGLHLWLETGAVGAILAAALALLVVRAALRAPGLTRVQAAAGAAAFGAYVMMAQMSYGVWQEWWTAAIAWAAASAALVGPFRASEPHA